MFKWESRKDRVLRESLWELQEEYIQSLEKNIEFWKNEAYECRGNITKLKPFVTTFNESFGTNLVIDQDNYTVEEGSSDMGGYLELSRFVNEGKRIYESEKLDKRLTKELDELSQKYPNINVKELPSDIWGIWGEKTLLEAYEAMKTMEVILPNGEKVKEIEYRIIDCPDCGRQVNYGVVKGEERKDEFECDVCEHVFKNDEFNQKPS